MTSNFNKENSPVQHFIKTFSLLIALFLFTTTLQAQTLQDTIKLNTIEIRDFLIVKMPYIKNEISNFSKEKHVYNDLGDLLRNVPNVSGIRKGGSNIDPVVRGFKFSQLNTILNSSINIEGGCPNRMDPTSSRFDIEDIEKIEIIKGPYALRYGPVFGSVVNFIPSMPEPYEKFEIHARSSSGYVSNLNSMKQHIQLKFGNKNAFFLLSGNYLKSGNYLSGGGEIVKALNNRYGYNIKAGFAPHQKHTIYCSYLSNYAQNVSFPALPMDERTDKTNIVSIDYKTSKLSETINSITANVFNANVNHLMDNKSRPVSDTMIAVSDVRAKTMGGKAEINLQLKTNMQLTTGINYHHIEKNGKRVKTMLMQPLVNGQIPTKTEKLWNNAQIDNIGAFAEYKANFNSYHVFAALRFDYNSAKSSPIELLGNMSNVLLYNDNTSSEFFNISGSLGAGKQLGEHFEIDLSVGRGVRSPDMLERFIILLPVGYDNFEYMGNPKLKPEANNEADLTFKFLHDKYGSVLINGFFSYVQNFITGEIVPPSQQKPLTQSVMGVKKFTNAKTAWFTGFEFRYTLPKKYRFEFDVTAAYTYGVIQNVVKPILDFSKIPSQRVVDFTTLKQDAISEIPPLETRINLGYRFNKFVPMLTYRYVASQKHVSEAYYERTTPQFHLVNFSILYTATKHITFSGGVNNIFNIHYYEHLNRRIIGTTKNLYEPGRAFFVNLTLSI